MSNEQEKQQPKRPMLSDTDAIQMQFGPFLNHLRENGIPTPSKAELRQLLYSALYVTWDKSMKDYQEQYLDSLKNKLPQVHQALKEYDDRRKPPTPPAQPLVPGEPVDAEVITDESK